LQKYLRDAMLTFLKEKDSSMKSLSLLRGI